MIREYVVLIPLHFDNAKIVADKFRAKTFDEMSNALKCITDTLTNDEVEENEEVLVYAIQRFLEALNDETIYADDYFLTNIFIEPN